MNGSENFFDTKVVLYLLSADVACGCLRVRGDPR
jgi:hypothetical protein